MQILALPFTILDNDPLLFLEPTVNSLTIFSMKVNNSIRVNSPYRLTSPCFEHAEQPQEVGFWLNMGWRL
jgi:hypothetical protein